MFRCARVGQGNEYWSENRPRDAPPPCPRGRTVFKNVQNTEAWNMFSENVQNRVCPLFLESYRLPSRRMAFLCPTSHAPLQHLGAQLGGSLPLYTTDMCQGGRSNDRLAHPAAYAPVEHRPSEEATH